MSTVVDEPEAPVQAATKVAPKAKPKASPKVAPKVTPKSPPAKAPSKSAAVKVSRALAQPVSQPADDPAPSPVVLARVKMQGKAPGKRSDKQRQIDREIAGLLRHGGDATRVAILMTVGSAGSANVTAIVSHLGSTQPAISHHLAIMRHARLVETSRAGKMNFYSLTPAGNRLFLIVESLMP